MTRVRFVVPGIADPQDVTTPTSGTIYQKEITVTTPAAGTPFSVKVIVSDANSDHDQTVEQLLFYLPRDYQDLTDVRPIAQLESGKLQTVRGRLSILTRAW